MNIRLISFLFVTFSVFSIVYGQIAENNSVQLTGNLYADSKIVLSDYRDLAPALTPVDPDDKKSTLLAGVMSAVLPGSGELYVGDYLKAGIFFAIEAAIITIAVINDNEGDDLTAKFEAFADEHWSVVDYANWLNTFEDAGISIDPDESKLPWARIDDWSALNAAETGHRLPLHGEQQYYELIGKYPQYSPGWDEFDPDNNDFHDVPQIMNDYSVMRGLANDSYNIAAKAVIGIYINHLLSAVDAIWSASNYNSDLALKMQIQNIQFAGKTELIPTLNIQYSF